MSLNNVSKDTDMKLADIYITAGKTGTEEDSIEHNWSFNFRHYILKEDIQNDNIDKEFQGHIYFKAIRCFEGKGPGKNLLDSPYKAKILETYCFKDFIILSFYLYL